MLHTIHFLSLVTTTAVSQLQHGCLTALQKGATEINIHISSSGGETSAGFTAYNFLKSMPIIVRTHNISNVESIANVIFLAGSERFTNPLSRFVLHPLLWSFNTPIADHSRLREYGKCLDNDIERFVEIFNAEIGTAHRWGALVDDSTILNAEQAVEMSIAHTIKPAKLTSGGANWWVTT